LAAVKGKTQLVARGRVLRRSKRLAFVTSELRDQDRLVASSESLYLILNFLFAGLGSGPPGPMARTLKVYQLGFSFL
jgi:hypothetical protein